MCHQSRFKTLKYNLFIKYISDKMQFKSKYNTTKFIICVLKHIGFICIDLYSFSRWSPRNLGFRLLFLSNTTYSLIGLLFFFLFNLFFNFFSLVSCFFSWTVSGFWGINLYSLCQILCLLGCSWTTGSLIIMWRFLGHGHRFICIFI